MSLEITVTDDVGAAAGAALAEAIAETILHKGRCRLALSGGTAPIPVFRWLADNLPSSLVDGLVITWIDERHLPLDPWAGWEALPEDSNLRLAWEHWWSRAGTSPAVIVPMARPGTLDEATAAYATAFEERLGGVDIALLGVGPDGHIASLFPGHPALEDSGVCVAVPDSPKPPPERISLTLSVLEDVDYALLVALGGAKASVLRRAREHDSAIPLGRYLPRGTWRWFVDPEAAAEL